MLNTAEAARRLGLSVSFLAKQRLAGSGPAFIKLGARVVYDPDDLAAWLAVRRRSSTSDLGKPA